MPDNTLLVFRRVNIGGTSGLEAAGSIIIRDDNGFRDDFLDDIEQAPSSETNGDQEIVGSSVTELDIGDTIRARGVFRFTNNDTGEVFDVSEVFSNTAGNPTALLFAFTTSPPAWVFDNTSRSFILFASDATILYSSFVCFAAGTTITHEDGRDIPVEALKTGDQIITRDGSAHPVRWIGSRKITPHGLASNPRLRPVRIKSGALGSGLPKQDLLVSRQHRVLIRSAIAARVFGTHEVLVPAIKLIDLDGIDIADDVREVTYFHILFDQHQIVYSNGAPTESLFTGPEALKSISAEARTEIETLFPELADPDFNAVPASLIPKKPKDIKKLVMRHQKNRKPLFSNI